MEDLIDLMYGIENILLPNTYDFEYVNNLLNKKLLKLQDSLKEFKII